METRLIGFDEAESALLAFAFEALASAGYETDLFAEVVRADLPAGYRAMTLDEGAALGPEAFGSDQLLCHVLEEELLHLKQKLSGQTEQFGPGTARMLEEAIDVQRRFPAPGSGA